MEKLRALALNYYSEVRYFPWSVQKVQWKHKAKEEKSASCSRDANVEWIARLDSVPQDMPGIPPIVLPLEATTVSTFSTQLLCNTQTGKDLAGSHHIFPPRTPPRPPQEPVRPRQDKHVAEKEKPDVPKEHTEARWQLQVAHPLLGQLWKWLFPEIPVETFGLFRRCHYSSSGFHSLN